TRRRLYLETMQDIMTASSKVMIDAEVGNNMLYLPLDQIMKQAASPTSKDSSGAAASGSSSSSNAPSTQAAAGAQAAGGSTGSSPRQGSAPSGLNSLMVSPYSR